MLCSLSLTCLFCSPANTALGVFEGIVPIVVACAEADDANVVYSLHDVFARASATDAHSIAYGIDNAGVNVQQHDMYAIRTGMETGIYIGFNWYADLSITYN